MIHQTVSFVSILHLSRFYGHDTMFFHIFVLVSVINGLAMATLPWMLAFCSPLQTVFVDITVDINCCHFAELVLCYLDTILPSVRQSYH